MSSTESEVLGFALETIMAEPAFMHFFPGDSAGGQISQCPGFVCSSRDDLSLGPSAVERNRHALLRLRWWQQFSSTPMLPDGHPRSSRRQTRLEPAIGRAQEVSPNRFVAEDAEAVADLILRQFPESNLIVWTTDAYSDQHNCAGCHVPHRVAPWVMPKPR